MPIADVLHRACPGGNVGGFVQFQVANQDITGILNFEGIGLLQFFA